MVEGTQEKEDNNSSHEPTTIATANLERGNPFSTDDASHNDSSGQNLSLRALPKEPVMGNAIENLAANLMSMAEAPPLSHCQSVKHNGQIGTALVHDPGVSYTAGISSSQSGHTAWKLECCNGDR